MIRIATTGTVLNMRSATFFGLLLYSGSPSISRTHPSPCASALPTLTLFLEAPLPHATVRLGYQPVNLEIIQT